MTDSNGNADALPPHAGKAGFRLTRVVPTASPVSVVEAVIA